MTWLRAIGGPAHDRWFDVDLRFRQDLVVPVPRPVNYAAVELPDPTALMGFETVVYTVERLVWPGWRFPLRVLVAPGVKIQGHPEPYDSSWPNPLVPARCRCEEIEAFPPWVFAIYNNSACHLDHCPVHGAWTFPPITPLHVSLDARATWLDAEARGLTMLAPGEYHGLEPAPERRHTPSTAPEPDSNRAHTE